MNKIRFSFALVLITAVSITANIAANLVSGRLGFFGPWVAPMGVFFFPLIYVLSDVTSDVYGYRISRWVAWVTLAANLVFVGGIMGVISLITPAPFAIASDEALRLLLVGSDGATGMIRVVIAGIIAAVLGGWINDIIFQVFRAKDGTEKFLKRKLISSIAAEIVDTLVFITLAFAFTPSWGVAMYIVQFVLKYGVEVVTAPIARVLAKKVRAIEGDGVFENRNRFNVFGFEKKS